MNWDRASRLEWLEANGLGGYASSTIACANTRRYHGLLVPAMKPPVERFVLLSKLDERITISGRPFDLASNIFPGVIHPRGFEHLDKFERDVFPLFDSSAGGVRVRKTIAAIHGENTTVILYEVSGAVTIELRPFIAGRDYHHLTSANDAIRRNGTFDRDVFALSPYDGVPSLYVSIPGASFHAAPDWYYRFEYPVERDRGLDDHEDLFTPGTFTVEIKPGTPLAIIASTDNPRGRDGRALLARERHRRERLIEGKSGVTRRLALAADQFIVRRGVDRCTIVAGYHWFTDWGRDAMISLPGLCLLNRRYGDARQILVAFARCANEGMLPNRFPDAGEQAEYNTVDAALWFFVASKRYLDATHDETFVQSALLPVLRDIIAWYERGTRYNIHEDVDGLLFAGVPGVQLTWMDARIGDRVVTPRIGKPVEINALWVNALLILAGFERRWGVPDAASTLESKAERARERFREVFWNHDRNCLFDVINGDERDASIRPNQIFAISLPHPLIDGAQAEAVLKVVEERLLTPLGLRTLDPADPQFASMCRGTMTERDWAYHQGTVWPWLIGPYVDAVLRVRGPAGIAAAKHAVDQVAANLDDACVGSISEIADGVEPFMPRGCIAQAWSVAEIARVIAEDLK